MTVYIWCDIALSQLYKMGDDFPRSSQFTRFNPSKPLKDEMVCNIVPLILVILVAHLVAYITCRFFGL